MAVKFDKQKTKKASEKPVVHERIGNGLPPKGTVEEQVERTKKHVELRPAYMESSDDATFAGSVVFIHSPAGSGKTTFAATVSAQCPFPLPAAKKTTIEDVFYLGTDSKGSLGLRSVNLNLANVFDLNLFMSRKERWETAGYRNAPTTSEAFLSSLDIAGEWAYKNPGGHLIVDTVSKLDSSLWVEFGAALRREGEITGSVNGLQVSGMILQYTREIHDRILNMPFETIIYLAHEKPLYEFSGKLENPNAKRMYNAGKALEGATVIPAVTGQSVGVYNRDAILELSIAAPRDPQTGRRKRWVYCVPHEGREVKNRFEAALADKEEPCLRRILEKARNYQP